MTSQRWEKHAREKLRSTAHRQLEDLMRLREIKLLSRIMHTALSLVRQEPAYPSEELALSIRRHPMLNSFP